MKNYSEFRPTGHDFAGLNLPDRQDWLVLPCGRNRDSSVLDESNFETAQKLLETAFAVDCAEVHRFGHWACGWFEIILVSPLFRSEAEAIEARLADYPVLDEDDWSAREFEAACEAWKHTSMRERMALSSKYRFPLMACRRDELPCDDSGELVSYLAGE